MYISEQVKRQREPENEYDENINKFRRCELHSKIPPKAPIVPPKKIPQVPPKKNESSDSDSNSNDDQKFIFFLLKNPLLNSNEHPKEPPKPPIGATKRVTTCRNPLCNHKTKEEDPTEVIIPTIKSINNITDIIELGKSYHCKKNTEFAGMSLRLMCNLIPPLTELKNMVGMENVKESMVDQILFFLQGHHADIKCGKCMNCSLNKQCANRNTEMLHTVITGPPGVGKTEVGKILGKVYNELEVLSTGTFKLVSRSDLIAGYLGQTAIKTQKVIDECKGGVLFIDEAYSLGSSELKDSFSKECIDTLNKNLSERRDFLCIIAGYKDELEKCFFKYNDGLKRRFTFRYDVKSYTYENLLKIFELKVNMNDWKLHYANDESLRKNVLELFKKNANNFPNFGGDMETLLLKCKICHCKRCTFKNDEGRRTLSYEDIENGLNLFLSHRKSKNDSKKNSIYS